ncbi:MAG: hypothetical protein ER33_05400 [Cyanobium sp. CACIAM 14]|nr:MAG: hypothetical protein ER33_05400 [Cyanobium sp. CACIAM 14]
MRSSEPPDPAAGPDGDGLLPEGPLTMSRLLALEPEPLRRLLTLGLRAGLEETELERLCEIAAGSPGPAAADLRAGLQQRGWLGWDADRRRWRTRLGAATSGDQAPA